MLTVQQKDCKCELFAYQQVKYAYAQYQSYLKSVSSYKSSKYKANAARLMALKFLQTAIIYKKRSFFFQSTSAKLASRSSSQKAKFAMFKQQSASFLTQYQMTMKRYMAMRVMMTQLMRQAMSFRKQYVAYKAKSAMYSGTHNFKLQSRRYYMASLNFMKQSGFNMKKGMQYMAIYRAYL